MGEPRMEDLGIRDSAGSAPVSALLTFLIADVRGYTRYSAQCGDHAATHLSELFLALCREVISAHGGEVFGTAGDQALAAFSSVHAALRAALALQVRLAHEQATHRGLPLRAGIGVDAGEAVRIGNDYRGNAINLAARLCSIAGAGEILASETVVAAARVVEGVAALDLGEINLKGLMHEVRVFLISPEGAVPEELPDLGRILVTHPTNLPDASTPFIGREGEVDGVARLLRLPPVRLVTLTGPGGTGKTRLALQVGSTLLHDFQDGVFFVNLAPLIDPALVPSTIAEVLAVKEEAGKGLVESLADVLRDKHVLLILDNYEHVLDASSVVSSLLDRCRELHVLVTSRIPLHLAREHEYAVPPLAVPDPRHLPDVETLSQFEAVALFIERATAVMADFQVTNQNAPAVAEICSRLDGLPLAIELAAARIKLFPPQALLRRLSSRLKVLTGGPRDRPSRQQTLRNAIDWSYSLLSDDDQILFARLSVFAGGCDFEAVEAICDSTGELDVLDGISSLVDKSLLRPGGTESARMAMLQTIREYAREKLQERGEQEEIQAAHAGYFLALAEAAEEELVGGEQGTWLARLDEDLDDLRVALRWFLDHGESEGGLRLAAALYEYWRCRGSWNEGRRWLQEGLTQDDHAAPSVRAKALWVLGLFANLQGETNQARLWLEEAFGLYQELGDRRGRARVMETLGMVALWQGQYERAAALYEEGLHLSQELDDQTGMAWNLFGLGTVAWNRGELAGATRHYEETLALSRTAGNIYTEALTLTLQGQIALHQRDLAEAERLCGESLALAREAAVERIVAFALWLRSRIAEKRGHLDDAEGWARESLLLAREQRERFLILFHLGHMAKLAIARGDPHRAARLYGAEMGQRERLGIPLPHTHQADEEEMLAQTKALLDIDTFTRIGAQGQAMNLEEAIAYALEERM